MRKHEIVVRIIQPSDQPYLPGRQDDIASPETVKKNSFRRIAGVTALAALVLIFMIGFSSIGVGLRDILVIAALPLIVGLVTSYATF